MCKLKIFVIALLTLILFGCGGSTPDRSADINKMVEAEVFMDEEDARCIHEAAAKHHTSDAGWNYYVATVMGEDLPDLSDSETASYGINSLSLLSDMENECEIFTGWQEDLEDLQEDWDEALEDWDEALDELENFSWD